MFGPSILLIDNFNKFEKQLEKDETRMIDDKPKHVFI